MSWQKVVMVITVLLLILIACLGRYTIIGVSANDIAYRLDRWTGEVVVMQGYEGSVVSIEK